MRGHNNSYVSRAIIVDKNWINIDFLKVLTNIKIFIFLCNIYIEYWMIGNTRIILYNNDDYEILKYLNNDIDKLLYGH